MPRQFHLLSAAVIGLLALSACDNSEPAPPPPEVQQQRPAPAPMADPVAEPEPTAPKDLLLNLATDGLQLVDPADGSVKPLKFGLSEGRILAALTPIRGEPARERETENDCGLTGLIYRDGLTLSFDDDAFTGWRQEMGGEISTANGVKVGMTRAALTAAASPDFTRIGGMEAFTIGDLSGVMNGDGPQATVQSLYAGEPCIAS
ncbi:MAG: hypothetical protein WA979_09360 [Pacificimonas sp.]